MKLYEEFKLFEEMWDDDDYVMRRAENPKWTQEKNDMRSSAKPVYKTFGSKKYDITELDELRAWVKENAKFQFKRHPNSYKHYAHANEKDEFTQKERHAKYIYITILKNLKKSLNFESMDANSSFCVEKNIHELIRSYTKDFSDREYQAYNRKIASETYDKDFDAFINKVFSRASASQKEYIKSELKDIYDNYIKSSPTGCC